jgi:hypothetical protein
MKKYMPNRLIQSKKIKLLSDEEKKKRNLERIYGKRSRMKEFEKMFA